jgi:hypothetical protein
VTSATVHTLAGATQTAPFQCDEGLSRQAEPAQSIKMSCPLSFCDASRCFASAGGLYANLVRRQLFLSEGDGTATPR